MTTYTPAQLEAIGTLDRPLHLVACAGSGKTQVISRRIVRLLEQPGVVPRNIAAFTFTDKAAAELKDCIGRLVEERFGNVYGLAEMLSARCTVTGWTCYRLMCQRRSSTRSSTRSRPGCSSTATAPRAG
jgi:superfamily I DNA/RNA helicase